MGQQRRVDGVQQGGHRTMFYYGWLVVGASFLITLLSMGTHSSFGNFLKPMSAEFGWDRATASLPAAVAILMNGLFQPLVGQLVDRVGPRRVITLSILVMAASTAATAFTPSIWYLNRRVWCPICPGSQRGRGYSQHGPGGALVCAAAWARHGARQCWWFRWPTPAHPGQYGAALVDGLARDLSHPRRYVAPGGCPRRGPRPP